MTQLAPDHHVRKRLPPSRRAGVRAVVARGAMVTIAAMIVGVLSVLTPAVATPTYPALTGQIVDNANLISAADREAILTELRALEGTSTDQIAVVTVPSLEGYSIEDYAIGLARQWAIGQKDKDNGIVLLVAPNERKVRIEVGRRLEPIMTDTMAALIVENAILSRFRRGDFSGGIREGVTDIKSVLLGDAEEVARRATRTRDPSGDTAALLHIALFLAIVGFMLWVQWRQREEERRIEQSLTPAERAQRRARRRRARHGPFVIIPGNSGSWGGGSSGGGGWSGGGGGFGGGGASGSW